MGTHGAAPEFNPARQHDVAIASVHPPHNPKPLLPDLGEPPVSTDFAVNRVAHTFEDGFEELRRIGHEAFATALRLTSAGATLWAARSLP